MDKTLKAALAKAETTIKCRAIENFNRSINDVRKSIYMLMGDNGGAVDLLDKDFHQLVRGLINGDIERKEGTDVTACAIADHMISLAII